MDDWRSRKRELEHQRFRDIEQARARREAEVYQTRLQEGQQLAQKAVEATARLHRMIDIMCERNSDGEFSTRAIADEYMTSARIIVMRYLEGL